MRRAKTIPGWLCPRDDKLKYLKTSFIDRTLHFFWKTCKAQQKAFVQRFANEKLQTPNIMSIKFLSSSSSSLLSQVLLCLIHCTTLLGMTSCFAQFLEYRCNVSILKLAKAYQFLYFINLIVFYYKI